MVGRVYMRTATPYSISFLYTIHVNGVNLQRDIMGEQY